MENKTAEERFCKVYTEFYGAPIDKAEQIAEHRFNGNELMEFCEFYASQQLAEKDKEIERLIERNNFLEVQASTPDKIQIHVLEENIKIQDREINSLKKIISDIPDLLHDSLGETVALNTYSISPLATKVSEFWITHDEVGSGEPLKQWIKSEIEKSLNK